MHWKLHRGNNMVHINILKLDYSGIQFRPHYILLIPNKKPSNIIQNLPQETVTWNQHVQYHIKRNSTLCKTMQQKGRLRDRNHNEDRQANKYYQTLKVQRQMVVVFWRWIAAKWNKLISSCDRTSTSQKTLNGKLKCLYPWRKCLWIQEWGWTGWVMSTVSGSMAYNLSDASQLVSNDH